MALFVSQKWNSTLNPFLHLAFLTTAYLMEIPPCQATELEVISFCFAFTFKYLHKMPWYAWKYKNWWNHSSPSRQSLYLFCVNLQWSRISKETGPRGGTCTEKKLLYRTGSCSYGSGEVPRSAATRLGPRKANAAISVQVKRPENQGRPSSSGVSSSPKVSRLKTQAELLLQFESAGRQSSMSSSRQSGRKSFLLLSGGAALFSYLLLQLIGQGPPRWGEQSALFNLIQMSIPSKNIFTNPECLTKYLGKLT